MHKIAHYTLACRHLFLFCPRRVGIVCCSCCCWQRVRFVPKKNFHGNPLVPWQRGRVGSTPHQGCWYFFGLCCGPPLSLHPRVAHAPIALGLGGREAACPCTTWEAKKGHFSVRFNASALPPHSTRPPWRKAPVKGALGRTMHHFFYLGSSRYYPGNPVGCKK